MYPIFLKIEHKPCLVIGGGKVATRKVRDLVDESAKVTVVALQVSDEIRNLAEKKTISLKNRAFSPGETKGFFLVIAATNDHELNRFISEEAGTAILFNSVDEPDLCNFYAGAVIKRGALRVAVSTSGAFPPITKKIKADLDASLSASYGPLLEKLGEFRRSLKKNHIPENQRKQMIDRIVHSPAIDEFLRGNEEPLDRVLAQCV
jgi:precorrin-2 dehydrogenase / sirohydrochlorin ferrochelatase